MQEQYGCCDAHMLGAEALRASLTSVRLDRCTHVEAKGLQTCPCHIVKRDTIRQPTLIVMMHHVKEHKLQPASQMCLSCRSALYRKQPEHSPASVLPQSGLQEMPKSCLQDFR